MVLSRLTKITGPGIRTDTNWVGNNANYTGILTASSLGGIGNITATGIITASSFSGDGSGLIGVASTDNIVTGTAATFNTYPVDINAGMTVAGVATFAGNVSIAGTLTYEDVTNIDSVGIITGKGADINGDLDVDGHTNLDNVSVAGVSTFTGTSNLSRIESTATSFVIHNTADRILMKASNRIDLADNRVRFQSRDQSTVLLDAVQGSSGFVKLYQNGNERLATTSQGINVTGHSELDNVSIVGVTTTSARLDVGNNGTNAVDLRFRTNRGSAGQTIANLNYEWNGTTVAQIRGIAGSDTTNKDDGHLAFFTTPAGSGSFNERLRITSDGNMGLGDTAPPNFTGYTSLSIHGSTGGALVFGDDGTDEWEIYGGDGAVKIYDRANTQERIRISDNGAIGLGGANYGSSGQVLTSGGSGSAATWSTVTGTTISGNADNRVITGSGTANTLNAEQYLTWDGQIFKVNAATNDNPFQLDTGSSNGAHMRFFRNGTQLHFFGCGTGISLGDSEDLSMRSYDNILFSTGNSSTERLRIDSSGRVLIGATSGGNADTDDLIVSGSGKKGITLCSTDGSESRLTFADGLSGVSAVAGSILYTHSNDSMDFQTNTTRRLRIDSVGRVLIGTTTVGESSADDLTLSTSGHTGITIRSGNSNYGNIFFTDVSSGDQFQGYVQYNHSDNSLRLGTQKIERLRIASNGFVGIGEDDPQTKLDVRGTISTGRNVARELGTVINVSSNHDGTRVGSNVINGNKNYEAGADWLAQGGARVDANLTIDLGTTISCDRFVIYNQNEYSNSRREVKRFTLEGSNDNSSWTTILDDEAGCSNAHEPNPGWSFRIPSGLQDDDEGANWRYWRFTMKTFHQSDSYGGIMELELYAQTQTIQGTSEITTNSLVASDISAGTVRTCGQPSFLATASGNNIDIGSGGIFPFNTEQYDRTGSYNTSTYQFTAPVTGEYFFFYQVYRNSSTSAEVAIYVNNDAKRRNRCNPNGGDFIFAQSTILRLDTGDVVDLRSYNGNMDNFYGSGSNQRESHFGGYLLG